MNKLTRSVYNVLLQNEFKNAYILQVKQHNQIISLSLQIPPSKELNDLVLLLPNLQQELKAHDYRIVDTYGKRVTILFSLNELLTVPFNKSYITPDTLQIKLPTPFDTYTLDFEDGASCHMLNGGAPRMGKTIFLLYTATMLYVQSQIDLYITSPKSKDFYPLFNLPNVKISQSEEEFTLVLYELVQEYKSRNTLLYSPKFKKATDAKTIKEFYPEHYHLFKPIFLIIDEYARFNIPAIHKIVAELVQTAGYVNIHVIIATQRPDARNTLPANIKMGLMARICFRTADKNNSIVILDEEGAENLPNVKGRAILKDGDSHIVQVPNISYEQCEELLQPYKKETAYNETNNNETPEGCTNTELTNKIQDLFSQSNSLINIQEQLQPNQPNKQSDETPSNGWYRLASKTDKR